MTILPRAEIDAFPLLEATDSLLAQAAADWRLQRCALHRVAGGVAAAVAHYGRGAATSPPLILVEIDNESEATLPALDRLADVCAQDTAAIIIGRVNDVKLYRELMALGISDYLVPPLSAAELVEAIARALAPGADSTGHRLAAVIGAKGGVGATTIAQALAWQTAGKLGDSTWLLDLVGPAGTAGIALGAEGKEGIETFFDNFSRLESSMLTQRAIAVGDKLSVLAGGRGDRHPESFDLEIVDEFLDRILEITPNLVVDLPTGWGPLAEMVAARADLPVLVTAPLPSALRGARRVLESLTGGGRGEAEAPALVVNGAGAWGKAEIPAGDISSMLGITPDAVIEHAPQIFAAAEMSGAGLGNGRAARQALAPLTPLARRLSGVPEPAAAGGGRKWRLAGG